jgi:hypothetical protein
VRKDGRKEFTDAHLLVIPPKGEMAFTVTHFDSVGVVWRK